MAFDLSTEQRDELEGLIDASSLVAVIDGLTTICYLKANHLRSNWQDIPAALAWERAGKRLDQVSSFRQIADVS